MIQQISVDYFISKAIYFCSRDITHTLLYFRPTFNNLDYIFLLQIIELVYSVIMRYSTRNTLKCMTFSPELYVHLKY